MTKAKVIFYPIGENIDFKEMLNKLTCYDIEEFIINKNQIPSKEHLNLITFVKEYFPHSKISALQATKKKIIQYKSTNYNLGRIRFD